MLRSRRETPAADLPERVSVAGLSEQVEGREDVRELLAGKPRRLDSSARQADVRAMRLGELAEDEVLGVFIGTGRIVGAGPATSERGSGLRDLKG